MLRLFDTACGLWYWQVPDLAHAAHGNLIEKYGSQMGLCAVLNLQHLADALIHNDLVKCFVVYLGKKTCPYASVDNLLMGRVGE